MRFSCWRMFEEIRDPAARVRALVEYGGCLEVDTNMPPRRYFRSGLEMIRMANVYVDEGNLESAFVLYSKFVTLFVEKLPKHPDFKLASSAEKAQNRKKLAQVFPLAETLKKKLKDIYTQQEIHRLEEEKRRAEELALEDEQRRQDEERRQVEEQARIEEENKMRFTREEELLHEQEKDLRRYQERERERLEQEEAKKQDELNRAVATAMGGVAIIDTPHGPVPAVPPPSYDSVLPSIPDRVLKPSAPSPHNLVNAVQVLPPSVDRTLKPLDHFTSTGGLTGNKHGLKNVIVPSEIVVRFVNMALANTSNNIETCGILCGKLSHNAFRLTHLVIPKQSGTPDSCTTESEEEMFEVQDQHDLITLGWIHTHPSQTAFLSSVDLHTHCSYQLMLPEAIAIVCAPKYQETGYFNLTPDHGLMTISSCKQGGFHPHAKEPPLFQTCEHVTMDTAGSVTVIDLRR